MIRQRKEPRGHEHTGDVPPIGPDLSPATIARRMFEELRGQGYDPAANPSDRVGPNHHDRRHPDSIRQVTVGPHRRGPTTTLAFTSETNFHA